MTSSTYTPGQATVTDTRTTTESWADGTHSVIWMKHGGSASVLTLGRQPIGSQAFSLTVVAVLSLPCLFWREFLVWPIKSMINSSVDVPFSFSTAEPGFWAAFGMAVLTAVFFQSLVANRPIILRTKKA